jgi:geranylgeranylglycerol-phosphate geranylgeranyltransferase
MASIAVLIAAILVSFSSPLQLFLACLVVFLISGAGMVINDYFDYKIDKVNKPERPIPSGRLSRKIALIYSLSLFSLANIIAIIFLNFQTFLLSIANTITLILYSWRIKRFPLLGNFCVSWFVASTFIFGSVLGDGVTVTIFILFLMAFSTNVGREIAKSIEDVKGDKKSKIKTLPIVAGKNFSALIASIFVIFAIIFSPLPYVFGLLNVYYIYLVIVADILFAISCFIIFLSPKKSQKLMKIAMFIALLSFLVGIL